MTKPQISPFGWTSLAPLAIGLAALTLATVSQFKASPLAAQAEGGLAGARPTIHAAQFSSLQAALDAVPEGGGKVILPAGEFHITEPLVLKHGDVLLEGCGAATHLVNDNQEGRPALIVQHPDGKQVAKDDRLWRVMLSNFRITGNPQSGHGVLAVLVEEIFLQGLTISYNGGDGVRLDHCYEDPRVDDCLFTYNKQVGLNLLGCHDIVVSGNQFEENKDALHCIDGFNLCMNGNCVDDHLQHGVVIENTYGSVVAGNMIEECNQAALIMDRDCYGNTVSANVIAHNGSGVLLLDAHGCAVSANTFTILKTKAVYVGPKSGRITLTGNNFSNSYIGEGGVKRRKNDLAAAGIVVDNAEHLVVNGNLFSDVTPGLEIADEARNSTLVGNVFTGASLNYKWRDSVVEQNVGP